MQVIQTPQIMDAIRKLPVNKLKTAYDFVQYLESSQKIIPPSYLSFCPYSALR